MGAQSHTRRRPQGEERVPSPSGRASPMGTHQRQRGCQWAPEGFWPWGAKAQLTVPSPRALTQADALLLARPRCGRSCPPAVKRRVRNRD